MADFTFRRGDICWFRDPIPVSPGTHITHGKHPAIIVSDDGNNINGNTVIIVPLTSKVDKKLYPGQFDINFCGTPSRVRCDQMRVVDKHTLDFPSGHLSVEGMDSLNYALKCILGIGDESGFATVDLVKEE